MSDDITNHSRRQFVKRVIGGALAVPVVLIASERSAFAADLPHLAADDPMAASLGYVHDSKDADAAKYTKHEASQKCLNCQVLQPGDGDWRPCPLFAGKAVNVKGWCSAWVKKAG